MARTKQTARRSDGGKEVRKALAERASERASEVGDPTRGGTRLPHPSCFESGEAFVKALHAHPSLFLMLRDDVHIDPLVAGLGDESDRMELRQRLSAKRMRYKEMHRRRVLAEAAEAAPATAPQPARASAAAPERAPSSSATSTPSSAGSPFGSGWVIKKRPRC